MKKIDNRIAEHFMLEPDDMEGLIRPRRQDSHKGTFGHGLLIAGQYGMAGAAILAARSCMRSGIGKLTVHTQECNVPILQISIPEAILHIERGAEHFSQPIGLSAYSALAIGCGLGTAAETQDAFIQQIRSSSHPLVIDADGLNILSLHKELIAELPAFTIITPHHGELLRLIGQSSTDDDELRKVIQLSSRHNIIVVMKGHHTRIVTPQGTIFVNPTGNPGMATAGSGDVLTGIILAHLSQGMEPVDAARLSVYIHGLAGDIAAKEKGEVSLLASDIIESLPKAFLRVTAHFRC